LKTTLPSSAKAIQDKFSIGRENNMADNIETIVEAPKMETVEAPKIGIVEKFTNIINANAVIADLRTDNARLVKDLAEAQNAFKNLQDMGQTVATVKADYDAKVADYEKKLADMKAEYENKIAAMSVDTQVTEEKVQEKAIARLASVGIETGAIEINAKVETAYDKFVAMPKGAARDAFFEANKEAILNESGARKA
jgi:hypothetical protein